VNEPAPAVSVCYVHAINFSGEYCPLCGPPKPEPIIACGKLTLHGSEEVDTLVIPCQRPRDHAGNHIGLGLRGVVIEWSDPT